MSEKEVFDLGQGHGSHMDCIIYDGERDEMIEMLPSMLETARLTIAPGPEIPCSLGEGYPPRIQCAMLSDTDDMLHLNMLIGCNIDGERNEMMSFYPEVNGSAVRVTLTGIREWENGLQATLEGTICGGGQEIAFFDTRYIAHKGKYKIGQSYDFHLSALAERCEVLENPTFKMEGQDAVDFKAKMGEKPEYDENGNVKPLVFDMSEMVAFFQHWPAYPHTAEFQSPAVSVSVIEVWGREYFSIGIAIAHDDNDNGICIPLIAKKTFFGKPLRPHTPIRGILYLFGY